MSLETATIIGEYANYFLILSLVIGVIATAFIAITANIKEMHWAKDRQNSNERIAEANAQALEAKLELEKFKKDRALSPEQETVVIEKLKSFAGQKYDVGLNGTDNEVDLLSIQLVRILTSAGWVLVDWVDKKALGLEHRLANGQKAGIISQKGVIILINPDKEQEFKKPALTLAESLNQNGVSSNLNIKEFSAVGNTDVIHVLIGRKSN